MPHASHALAVQAATASREGTALDNADAAYVHRLADGTVGAALVDGMGHGPHTSRTSPLLAEVAARIAARRNGVAGLLTAGELVADRGPDGQEANAVAVVAEAAAGQGFVYVSWIGDCRAYGWDGERLKQYTTDHTVGEQLRRNGAPWILAKSHDNWVQTSLADATVGTVYEVRVPGPIVLLTSDGVHDQTDHETLEALVREHADAPRTLANALVAAATNRPDGYRDDATVVVLRTAS